MNNSILLCSDLDRTILPNGEQEESPQARPLLRRLARREEITLVYVSGRHKKLIQDAIEDYQIPTPDYAIGDVGTTLYEVGKSEWDPSEGWQQEISQDWKGMSHDDLESLLSDFNQLRLQEPEKQNTFKLSYYADEGIDSKELIQKVRERLDEKGLKTSIIWSIGEQNKIGLLDILPERATKLHAIQFLMNNKEFSEEQTVFSGDSGNDLPALTSGLQAVWSRTQERMSEVKQWNKCHKKDAGKNFTWHKADFWI